MLLLLLYYSFPHSPLCPIMSHYFRIYLTLFLFFQRLSFTVSEASQADTWPNEGPSIGFAAKKEEFEEEDFTFDEAYLKKQKCSGQPNALRPSEAQALSNVLNMNWDLIEVLCCMVCHGLYIF